MGEHMATIDISWKERACCAPFGGGSWVPIKHNAAWAKAYLRIKWHLDPSNPLATTDMGQKLGGCAHLGDGELTQCGRGRGLPLCHVASWSIQSFGHNTPMLQTDRTDNSLIASGELFYKRSPKNLSMYESGHLKLCLNYTANINGKNWPV